MRDLTEGDTIERLFQLILLYENVLLEMLDERAAPGLGVSSDGLDLRVYLDNAERAIIHAYLRYTGGSVAATARLLKLPRVTLAGHMTRLDIKDFMRFAVALPPSSDQEPTE